MLFETLLFVFLSPGVLLTLPAVGKNIVMTNQTSLFAVLVHAVLYAIIIYLIENYSKYA
jgi:hypothetical protein